MILSRSAVARTVITFLFFLLFGIGAFVFAYFVSRDGQSIKPPVTIGVIFVVLAALSVPLGIYAEGKAKLFSEGTRLVRRQLQPDSFIASYNEKTEAKNAVCRPGYDLLELLLVSYRLKGDVKNARKTVEAMKALPGRSARAKALIAEAELCYENGDVEEGDALISGAKDLKPGSSLIYAMADICERTAKALATGDTQTAETYYNGVLSAPGIMKAEEDAALFAHWQLFRICDGDGRVGDALTHLKACATSPGKTAIKTKALSLLR